MTDAATNDSGSFWAPTNFVLIVLRGVGQVLFQDNAATGLLFLIGIAVESWWMAAGALVGAILGPVTAALAGFKKEDLHGGLYGFNSVLVGTGSLFYLKPTGLTWALVVIGCIAAAFVTNLMRRHLSFSTFTAPFVVTTWILILVIHAIAGPGVDVVFPPAADLPIGFLNIVLRGTAEIMFGANMLTGLFFMIGLLVSNRMHAFLAFFGSFVGTVLSFYHHNPVGNIDLGIYGYNAALVAIGVYLWRPSILISLLAAAITVPLTEFFPSSQLGIPALTSPFVVAAWIVFLIAGIETAFLKEQRAV